MWKDVPNPNKCSWANGLDFKKVKTKVKLLQHFFKHLFYVWIALEFDSFS